MEWVRRYRCAQIHMCVKSSADMRFPDFFLFWPRLCYTRVPCSWDLDESDDPPSWPSFATYNLPNRHRNFEHQDKKSNVDIKFLKSEIKIRTNSNTSQLQNSHKKKLNVAVDFLQSRSKFKTRHTIFQIVVELWKSISKFESWHEKFENRSGFLKIEMKIRNSTSQLQYSRRKNRKSMWKIDVGSELQNSLRDFKNPVWFFSALQFVNWYFENRYRFFKISVSTLLKLSLNCEHRYRNSNHFPNRRWKFGNRDQDSKMTTQFSKLIWIFENRN